MSKKKLARKLADTSRFVSIYQSCLIEGIDTTLHDVDMFLKGMENASYKAHESHFIWCMKEAWLFLLEQLGTDNNLMLIREMNKIVLSNGVHDSGRLRDINVSIGGTSWKPDIPIEGVVLEDIERLNGCKDAESKAIAFFCYLTRSQLFIDGNKRVAQLIANKILIENGVGMLNIPENAIDDLRSILIGWYETGDPFNLFAFMRDRCIERV